MTFRWIAPGINYVLKKDFVTSSSDYYFKFYSFHSIGMVLLCLSFCFVAFKFRFLLQITIYTFGKWILKNGGWTLFFFMIINHTSVFIYCILELSLDYCFLKICFENFCCWLSVYLDVLHLYLPFLFNIIICQLLFNYYSLSLLLLLSVFCRI